MLPKSRLPQNMSEMRKISLICLRQHLY